MLQSLSLTPIQFNVIFRGKEGKDRKEFVKELHKDKAILNHAFFNTKGKKGTISVVKDFSAGLFLHRKIAEPGLFMFENSLFWEAFVMLLW